MSSEAALDDSGVNAGSPSISPSPEPADNASTANGRPNDKSKKRAAADDGSEPPHKVTKRRAARACVSCRARKVRCDVVEGAPCGNCRWDNVECIVQESRRRKKNLVTPSIVGQGQSAEAQLRSKAPPSNPIAINSADLRRTSGGSSLSPASLDPSSGLLPNTGIDGHVPHMIYQRSAYRNEPILLSKGQLSEASRSSWANSATSVGHASSRTSQSISLLGDPEASGQLPPFVRPLPSKISPEDVRYLHAKGALSVPCLSLQNALLRAYIEFVHPYMPLMDLLPFLSVINRYDGSEGQISLFLYHAVMFSATAFVDMRHLREAGYATRKAARKAFFLKTRLLYDFDYESDRLVLVQGLLLMTYWYETPDDQKDTWHWMGVAISLAHTIGLHRNPEVTTMAVPTQKLWKRIWWSCFMRDRLIALGMRRPTRIKDEDFDVPMLAESDFELAVLPDKVTVVPPECTLMRDVEMQRELAIMCIAKAKLCICISHMLKAQYSVLIRDNMKPENTTNSTMMLFPNKKLDNLDSVKIVDGELKEWVASLPECCQYRMLVPADTKNGRATVAVQRTLLHMVYHTTISALHRPQFLPSSPMQAPTASRQVQEMSRLKVKDAATHITSMATELHHLRLERYLPTTGVTVILPAMIIHLLEMKNPMPEARGRATRGFRQCMRVMEKLREIYAAADYATGFLDAALRKAAIDINATVEPSTLAMMKEVPPEFGTHTPPPENAPYMTASETLFNQKPKPVQKPMGPPGSVNPTAQGTEAVNSPPHTEFDSSNLTPSVSGGSDEVHMEMDSILDVDFMQGHDEFDWNAVAGTDFDVDQWLQFPPEGVTATDETLMASAFTGATGTDDALDWVFNTNVDGTLPAAT
ncbi:Cutinase transcription factor 1 beta [Trichoderma asperellum]|uniref:Cutinase transcription factor 1 beta n=1 Tax=Trichoderma asperellum TaxID=101201 RepID=UPI00332AA081|nr:Cutinase transcription factor 1 beta [Trichoderma asperellum]